MECASAAAELRPYDYGQAVITEGLWFAEESPAISISACRCWPVVQIVRPCSGIWGGALQCVDVSRMFDPVVGIQCPWAWIKLYKATPASRDSQISYRLGAAVAFCLDMRLRQRGPPWPPSCGSYGRAQGVRPAATAVPTSRPLSPDGMPTWRPIWTDGWTNPRLFH